VYSTVEISPNVAERVRDFYKKTSFLPPPRAPLEHLREHIILEYDLYSVDQVKNFQSATDLVQAFFGGICTFTLFRANAQELVALSGSPDVIERVGLVKGTRLLPETSLCGHCILNTTDNTYVSNLAMDWRYHGNPYADETKGVKSYVGCVVSLDADLASPVNTNKVPIGVINIMHVDEYAPPPTAEQTRVLEHVRRMLEVQLRASWEGYARSKEAQARRAVSQLLESEHFTLQPLSLVSNDSDASLLALSTEALRHAREVLPEITCIRIIDLRPLIPVVSHISLSS
jgi:hypothetical protein